MTSFQRAIKYASICFAFFLVFVIITSIVGGIYTAFSIFDSGKSEPEYEVENISCSLNGDIKSLDIDTNVVDLKLLIGDSFDVKTNNKNINCKQDGSVLKIKESGVVNSKNIKVELFEATGSMFIAE